jgi:hypothetical protein
MQVRRCRYGRAEAGVTTFNRYYAEMLQEDEYLQQADPADLRLENAGTLEVLAQLRTWIRTQPDMAMPGPQDRFAESVWHGVHLFLSYGAVNWDIHWRTIGSNEETLLPVEDSQAQRMLANINMDAICWSVHELCRINGWQPPDIDFIID